MESSPPRRKGNDERRTDYANASGSFTRPIQPKLTSRDRTKAGTSPRLAPLQRQPSYTQLADAPFSPTHMSPTDETPRLQEHFAVRPSASSQSLYAAFAELSLARSPQSDHQVVSSYPSKHFHNSINNGDENIAEITAGQPKSTNQRRLSRSPPRIVSSRNNLPLIQTTFEISQSIASNNARNTRNSTSASDLVASRTIRGPLTTPKTSLSVHHDSPGTSTTLATPSSMCTYPSFHFSPARHLSEVTMLSPATSFADSNDMHHTLSSKDQDEEAQTTSLHRLDKREQPSIDEASRAKNVASARQKQGEALPIVSKRSESPDTMISFTNSQISESPGRMEVDAARKLSVPNPHDRYSSASAPTTPSKASRLGRPILSRLNTSEAVKKNSADTQFDPARKLSSSTSRLAVNTSFGNPRSATLSEGFRPDPASLRPRVNAQGEGQLVTPDLDSILGKAEPRPSRQPAHNARTAGKSVFEPSEILKGFLYLGPDISSQSEVQYLKSNWGIKRIINAAQEVEDGGGAHLNLNNADLSGIEKYKKISMKDTVEATGVQEDIEEACAFIDDAKLHSAPVYVHCKAGKSRSVLLVMAYLIHSNRWPLAKAYSYVVDRRHTVSPNIGFVAELMTFEQRRLNPKSSCTLARPSTNGTGAASLKKGSNRESLPNSLSVNAATAPFWDHLASTQGKRGDGEAMKTLQQTSARKESEEEAETPPTKPHGIVSLMEYKGCDGRYHARRPPADEKLQAPTWRSTMAAIDSEHPFFFPEAASSPT